MATAANATPPASIVIAGGGIGGLAAAMVLAQDGHAVTVEAGDRKSVV